jgi:hypothetical protein
MVKPPSAHPHADFELAGDIPGVDGRLVCALVGAAYADCPACQHPLLTRIGHDLDTALWMIKFRWYLRALNDNEVIDVGYDVRARFTNIAAQAEPVTDDERRSIVAENKTTPRHIRAFMEPVMDDIRRDLRYLAEGVRDA